MSPPLQRPLLTSSISCSTQVCRSAQSRSFSATSQQDAKARPPTRARRALFRWLHQDGANFLKPRTDSTNYLFAYDYRSGQLKRVLEAAAMKKEAQADKDKKNGIDTSSEPTEDEEDRRDKKIPTETTRDLRVYPHNPSFLSQPVLDEPFREAIWEQVMLKGKSVREVSASLRVEMSRVGAVVRLKEIEKEWQRIGKPLAKPYAEAVMTMLPKTAYNLDSSKIKSHESINDLPVHSATGPQIFHPTSESRHFTRADAAKVFDEKLLPADDRVPHPELTLMHKDALAGMTPAQIEERQAKRDKEHEWKRQQKARVQADREAAIKKVDTGRYEFRFTKVNVDDIGKDGRGHKGVGWRYGVPHMDRSRAKVKIPTRVG